MSNYKVYRKDGEEYAKDLRKKILEDPRVSVRIHMKDGKQLLTAFSHWIDDNNRVTRVQANIDIIPDEPLVDRTKRGKDAIIIKLRKMMDKKTDLNVDLTTPPIEWSADRIERVEHEYLVLQRLKVIEKLHFTLSYQLKGKDNRWIRARIKWPTASGEYERKQVNICEASAYSSLYDPRLKHDAARKLRKELLNCLTKLK